jgi:hypothetical protein
MSKSKKEVNNNELLTLLPKKEKQEIVKPKEVKTESSVFNNVIQEKTLISITEQNVNTPLLPEKLKKAEVIIFEFTYLALPSKVETTIYTYTEPTIKSNGIILITEAFGRQSFEENILGIKEVFSSCRKPLDKSEIIIDLFSSVLIKAVKQEEWMDRDYNETKVLFDNAVLQTYRELAAKGITTSAAKPNVAKRVNQKPANDPNVYVAGNLPPHSRPTMEDFY